MPLSQIGNWPTHDRFRRSGAGRVAVSETELIEYLNRYLLNPDADREARQKFISDEVTYTDGNSGHRTAEYLLSLVEQK